MTNSVTQTFSLTNEILKVLDDVCKETGMKRSAVVQELILKAGKDEKTREIIYLEHCKKSMRKKKMSQTSNNVQNVNGQKNDSDRSHLEPEPAADSEALTLSHDQFGIVKKPTYEEFQKIMERCKHIWQQED